jgi:cardiolipin synthase
MNWLLLSEIVYVIIAAATCAHIIYNTSSTAKTLAYMLLTIFIPIVGIIVYFSLGINYRKRELYSKKLIDDDNVWQTIKQDIHAYSLDTYNHSEDRVRPNLHLAQYLANEMSPLTSGNAARLLVNGEEKFPAVLEALKAAKEYIHIEYYIYENDTIGQMIEQILIQKSKEGVTVRFIYDDFGSKGIRKNIARRLRDAGIEAYPFYKIKLIALANHLNYRDHRKIIVIDGKKAFVGGINISNRYVNDPSYPAKDKVFWRDTHLMIDGPGIYHLQYIFICDWNFSSGKKLGNIRSYFPLFPKESLPGNKIIQIAASGPDSLHPTILYSLLYAIYQAQEEILITTPYFIPEQSIMEAIVVAALGGVHVQLLVPGKSDSKLVGLAAASYYEDLLAAGVKIYSYQKGFVHAKTMVVDKKLAIVGTANMDYRSFDLNFEVNAIVYDAAFAKSLAEVFEADTKDAELLDKMNWSNRAFHIKFSERVARLLSPLL